MSDNITIVTAFFDIGRGNWKPSVNKNGGPLYHYLERTADTYVDRFATLAKLDNEMVIYTSVEFADRVRKIREDLGKADRTTVVEIDLNDWSEQRAKYQAVFDQPGYADQIHPHHRRNPEYWDTGYVLVTSLKAHFVADAVDRGLCSHDTVAWIDFGYCRDEIALGGLTEWKHTFDPERIHYFNTKEFPADQFDAVGMHVVINNDPIIFGAAVVAHKKNWRHLANEMVEAMNWFMERGFVDDDQGLWMITYLRNPDLYELHRIDYADPFIVFRMCQ